MKNHKLAKVATVLTACGIETEYDNKRIATRMAVKLQQYLPLAVLKPNPNSTQALLNWISCNSTYRLRY